MAAMAHSSMRAGQAVCRPAFGSATISQRTRAVTRPFRTSIVRCNSSSNDDGTGVGVSTASSSQSIEKDISRFTRQAAATFAPRSSVAVKNPAYRGSALYWVFEGQAWFFLVVGGLLSFNIIFPTDEPSIPRLLGMWSIWMLTIPSLRAKECLPKEKDALNLLFLLVPIINVALPFVWKSFAFIFTADVAVLAGVYTWKGVWGELYLPLLQQGLSGGLPESTLVQEALAKQAADDEQSAA